VRALSKHLRVLEDAGSSRWVDTGSYRQFWDNLEAVSTKEHTE
jgi:hypothetical protein